MIDARKASSVVVGPLQSSPGLLRAHQGSSELTRSPQRSPQRRLQDKGICNALASGLCPSSPGSSSSLPLSG
ncbi:hypothetical protein E2C01_067623 [Portunus trituberculatus]|uniref:Uncharacterized protein n=1 Tax=Portunus trituberculatus TaxID=210409 RepID=A0A5B7HLI5_PORTR|nr:hypothetical protein [Portunus trituberculatus]